MVAALPGGSSSTSSTTKAGGYGTTSCSTKYETDYSTGKSTYVTTSTKNVPVVITVSHQHPPSSLPAH